MNSPRTAALQVANSTPFIDTKSWEMSVKWVTGVGVSGHKETGSWKAPLSVN